MASRQAVLALLLGGLAGCASQAANTGASPLPAGPKALIRAQYYGGLLNREAEAVFKVEEGAYVMVGHLGGDGRIDIVYPEDGRESGRVAGGKWFRTQMIPAYYDAAPYLYSFATTRYRSVGAQLDSYDGRGFGFLFLIASKRPLRFDRISDVGLWNDLVAARYEQSLDPRMDIKALASIVAGGAPYTLKFARSVSTVPMLTYADYRYDCALFQELGYASLVAPYGYSLGLFSPYTMAGYGSGCGNSFSRYAYSQRYTTYASTPSTPSVPAAPRPPTLTRPPHRPLGGTGSGLAFTNPTRRSSPQPPAAAAPRDWIGINMHRYGDWAHNASPRAHPRADRPYSTGAAATGASRPVSAPVSAPASAPAQPVRRSAPARGESGSQGGHPAADRKPS